MRGPSGRGARAAWRAQAYLKVRRARQASATKSWRSYRVLRPSGGEKCRLESVVRMQRFSTALFVAGIFFFGWPIHLDAKTVVVKAGWKETRTTLAQPDFRLKLQIQLKSNRKMKGIVTGTTGAGLRLERNGSETFIQRTEIHSIRLVPRKASSHRNRVLALAGGVPAGLGVALGAWHVGCAVAGGCGEPSDPVGSAGFYAVLVAVPVLLYKLAARADRGALLIILDDSVANHSLGSPVHRTVVIG